MTLKKSIEISNSNVPLGETAYKALGDSNSVRTTSRAKKALGRSAEVLGKKSKRRRELHFPKQSGQVFTFDSTLPIPLPTMQDSMPTPTSGFMGPH